ncbi:MAG: hypothetical protein GX162_00570 [Firmicutes bacterium]|nr:hypothetical protein [Bacillota bacterium]
MAEQRYRTNKIKRRHGVIDGLSPILEAMAKCPDIAQINPGRISASRRSGNHGITVQYFTPSGLKLLARNSSGIQEIFVVTSEPEVVKQWLMEAGLIQEAKNKRTGLKKDADPQRPRSKSASSRNKKRQRTSILPPQDSSADVSFTNEKPPMTVSDRLPRDTVDKLRQLPRHRTSDISGARLNGAKRARNPAPVRRKSQTAPEKNPLEVWLDQVSDDDIRRLADKLKGTDI